jgi:hypothetical protein
VAAGFHLTKWYLDAIAPDGSATIGYWARMSWGLLAVRYAAILEVPADLSMPVIERTSLLSPAEPVASDLGVTWKVPRLGVDTQWHADGPPSARSGIRHELLAEEAVVWQCLAPVARVQSAGAHVFGRPRNGVQDTQRVTGYAERLTMNMEPWKVPVDVLHWGRVAHATLSVVWIQWHGSHPLTLVFVDGIARADAIVRDTEISWNRGKITLEPRRIIRDATLGDGPAKSVPLLARAVPQRILDTHETKWLSSAILPSGDRAWAIHEVVRFGGQDASG